MSEPVCNRCGHDRMCSCGSPAFGASCYGERGHRDEPGAEWGEYEPHEDESSVEQARLRRREELEDLCDELEQRTAVLLRLARGDKGDCFERALGAEPPIDCACHIFYAGALAATAQAIERKMQRQRYHHGSACGCSKCFPRRAQEAREQRRAMNNAMRIERRDSEHRNSDE